MVFTMLVTAPFTMVTVVDPGYGRCPAKPPNMTTEASLFIRLSIVWTTSV